MNLHLVQLANPPHVDFSKCSVLALGKPFQLFEVWLLGKHSRQDGEKFGWLGFFEAGMAWRMVEGVGGEHSKGFEPHRGLDPSETLVRVVKAMKLAIDGGLAADREIKRILTP